MIATINRFNDNQDISAYNNHSTIIVQKVTDNGSQGEIDYIELPMVSHKHAYGFTFDKRKDPSQLAAGDFLRKGEVIYATPNLKEDGQYGTGINVDTALTPSFNTNEDGAMISETLRDSGVFDTHKFECIVVPIGDNIKLHNLFGTKDNWKGFPNIGEIVGGDGTVISSYKHSRNFQPLQSLSTSVNNSRTFYDSPKMVAIGSEVVDVKVTRSQCRPSTVPSRISALLDKHVDNDIAYNKAVLEVTDKLVRDGYTLTGQLSNYLATLLLYNACGAVTRATGARKAKTTSYPQSKKKIDIKEYIIEIQVRTVMKLNLGKKQADLTGGKSIICAIIPDEQCPRDQFGRIAHMQIANKSPVARNTMGLFWEMLYKDAQYHAQQLIMGMRKTHKIHDIFLAIADFLKTISTESYELLVAGGVFEDTAKQNALVADILDGAPLLLYIKVESDESGFPVLKRLRECSGGKWYPKRGKCTWISAFDGKLKTSKSDIRIAPRYTHILEKDATYIAATHSPRRNATGFSSKLDIWEKRGSAFSKQPPKVLSEAESKNLSSTIGARNFATLLSSFTNKELHEEKLTNRINAKDVTDIEQQIDYSAIKDKPNRGVQQLQHHLEVFGVRLSRTPRDEQEK